MGATHIVGKAGQLIDVSTRGALLIEGVASGTALTVSQPGLSGGILQSVTSLPKATLTITGNTVANPTIVTTEAHGLVTGDTVTITGNNSVPPINAVYPVTAINATTFSVAVNVAAGVNYTISGNTLANPTVVTTTVPHGLVNGDTVTISGSNSDPVIDGSRVVTVINTTTFSVPVNVTTAGTAGTVNHAKAGTAGAIAVSPKPVPAAPLAGRATMLVQNVGASTVYLGASTVLASTAATGGVQLLPGQSVPISLAAAVVLYGASSAAGGLVSCLEVSA